MDLSTHTSKLYQELTSVRADITRTIKQIREVDKRVDSKVEQGEYNKTTNRIETLPSQNDISAVKRHTEDTMRQFIE